MNLNIWDLVANLQACEPIVRRLELRHVEAAKPGTTTRRHLDSHRTEYAPGLTHEGYRYGVLLASNRS
jgi:hypothetical protein